MNPSLRKGSGRKKDVDKRTLSLLELLIAAKNRISRRGYKNQWVLSISKTLSQGLIHSESDNSTGKEKVADGQKVGQVR